MRASEPMKLISNHLEQVYKKLIGTAIDAILMVDDSGAIVHFSHSAELLFGYAYSDYVGRQIKTLIPKFNHNINKDFIEEINEIRAEPIIGEVIGKKKGNISFPILLSIDKTELNGKQYYLCFCHDSSSYKKALSEKLKVESLQSAMFNAAVDGIITITKQGLILSFNHAAENLFGYKSEEVINKNVKVLMPSPHQENHDSYLANYNNSKDAQIIGTGRDVMGRRKNGTNFPMRLSVGESEVNNEVVFIGICHDLTDYHNTQNKLAKAEERYKNIVECQGQIVCRINNELKVTFANQSFQDIFKKEKGNPPIFNGVQK